jgi:hypothetical protein
MGQAGGQLDFTGEAIGAHGDGDVRVQRLERHLASVPEVLRQQQGGHPAPPQLPDERVAPLESRAKLSREVLHSPRSFFTSAVRRGTISNRSPTIP